MRKFDKDGWPTDGLIVPTPEEFLHGVWVELGPAAKADVISQLGYDPDEDPRYSNEEDEAIARAAAEVAGNYHCGTQCCLVGWMGTAFGGATEPHMTIDRPLSPAHRTFAKAFLRAMKYEYEDYGDDYELLDTCSDAFEGMEFNDKTGLSGEMAQKYWIKAGEACGYDLSAFKKGRK